MGILNHEISTFKIVCSVLDYFKLPLQVPQLITFVQASTKSPTQKSPSKAKIEVDSDNLSGLEDGEELSSELLVSDDRKTEPKGKSCTSKYVFLVEKTEELL